MPTFDLGLEQVSLSYATKDIFDAVTIGVNEGDRIGIVGRNGDGKSTLLNLLSGSKEPDSGRISRRGGLSLGILQQKDCLNNDDTVRQAALSGRQDYEWAALPSTREIVETLLNGMSLDQKVGSLSGGQRRRVDLARLLVDNWDIILLDEPTNHLDLPTIHWLAEHLKNRWARGTGALLVVTHDRWFLDEVCTHMWEVHDGTIDPFEGGYSAYIEQRVERDRQADLAETKRRNLARKELAWLTRGARARSTKQKFHLKAARELIADVPEVRNTVQLKQMATSRLGKDVVDLVHVTQIYPVDSAENKGSQAKEGVQPGQSGQSADDLVTVDMTVDLPDNSWSDTQSARKVSLTGKRVLNDVTWLIGPGDRFGIVGANGVGKSTLLKIIDGSLTPTLGRVKIGKTVKFALLSQQLDELEKLGKYTVREVLSRYKPTYLVEGKEVTPSQLMERLGFESAQLMTPIRDLSGGQKRRMQLLLILLDEPNVLIMDEPGNDLDTDMLAVMEDLLDSWPGTLIVVSHDSYLLERVTDQQFALINGKIQHLTGGINDYFALLDQASTHGGPGSHLLPGREETSSGGLGQADDKSVRSAKREASKKSTAIERKLKKLSLAQEKVMKHMADHDPSDYEGLNDLNTELTDLKKQASDLEEEWLSLQEFIES